MNYLLKRALILIVGNNYIYENLLQTQTEGGKCMNPLSDIELIEPSDRERSQWPDTTRKYVETLEQFYDDHVTPPLTPDNDKRRG